MTAAPWPRTSLQTGWGHIGATLGPQTIRSERTTPTPMVRHLPAHRSDLAIRPRSPARSGRCPIGSVAPPYPLGPAGHRPPSGQPARIRSGTAGTPRRLLSWSFSRSFHRSQLQPTRAHWPESQPNLSCLDPTGTGSAEYRQLSPKQQVAGSSPARGARNRRSEAIQSLLCLLWSRAGCQRSWETPEGDKRSVTEIEADEVSAPRSSGPRPRSSGPASGQRRRARTTPPGSPGFPA